MRAKLSEGIRHAVTGKQSVAAAHSAELRSFRRGCMALRAFEDTVQGWVYDRAFFLSVGLLPPFYKQNGVKKELYAQKMGLDGMASARGHRMQERSMT